MARFELAIVGGGIVGLATAYRFQQRFPGRSLVLLEKEAELAQHQTGHNSGVLHSGIYYRPGSLKATNCRDGKVAMEALCQAEGIAYESCGKVIVAVRDDEIPRLQKIYERGRASSSLGVPLWMVNLALPIGFTLAGVQYLLTIVRNLISDDIYRSFNEKEEYSDIPLDDSGQTHTSQEPHGV